MAISASRQVREGDQRYKYFVFETVDDVFALPGDYPWLEEMTDCLFFATDGDMVYFYSVHPEYKPGIYGVELAAADWMNAFIVAESFTEMLSQGTSVLT